MEVFVASRESPDVLALVERLKALGLSGRDAAYLASVDLPATADPQVRANFLSEFRFMVGAERRAEAARLVGLEEW
ncbi:hypothetical protein E2493_17975 [Sphingomonas parva]|uniref:Uncharacterized protein n=1 Tax=Sphingomonas parva TaxID=2555898 RepID=A0A4Y8ZNP7_9SPHN|nr:hypothetical protein [Sphingomonas parva]TFI56892.1 hypothetical protein E2493_17975 [Sphingomonas parva]